MLFTVLNHQEYCPKVYLIKSLNIDCFWQTLIFPYHWVKTVEIFIYLTKSTLMSLGTDYGTWIFDLLLSFPLREHLSKIPIRMNIYLSFPFQSPLYHYCLAELSIRPTSLHISASNSSVSSSLSPWIFDSPHGLDLPTTDSSIANFSSLTFKVLYSIPFSLILDWSPADVHY